MMSRQESSKQAIYRALHRLDSPVVIAVASDAGWRKALGRDLSGVRTDRAVVVVPHILSRLVIDLIRRRRNGFDRPVPVRIVQRYLIKRGWTLVSSYGLWPSATKPRVALPLMNRQAASWLQRSGVLGGGRYPLVRMLMRSPLLTPFVMRTAGATALVVKRPNEQRER